MLDIPTVSGLEYIGSYALNDGKANFIQLYVNDDGVRKSFFRADVRPHQFILEDFLKEANIQKENCEWVGGGMISKAQIYSDRQYLGVWPHKEGYAVFGQCGPFQKYPDIVHLNSIRKSFYKDIAVIYDKIKADEIRLINDDYHEEWEDNNDPMLSAIYDD